MPSGGEQKPFRLCAALDGYWQWECFSLCSWDVGFLLTQLLVWQAVKTEGQREKLEDKQSLLRAPSRLSPDAPIRIREPQMVIGA